MRDRAKNFIPIPCLGQLHSPDQIIEKIEETLENKFNRRGTQRTREISKSK